MFKFNPMFKKTKYITLKNSVNDRDNEENTPNIPSGMWIKCSGCGKILYKRDLEENFKICPQCGKHYRMSAKERIDLIVDTGTFREMDRDMKTLNPLDFPEYSEKIKSSQEASELNEAVVTGIGKIYGKDAVIGIMDSKFMMGSMGSVVGEKLTRAIERATKERLPVIIFTASGGARMQEGMFSLMQMAKTSAAIARHNEEGLLYIAVLTDPTTGGVTASFAMLGDIILSEPQVLIGFAGRRVIEQTIKQKLPEGFQSAEFLLEHGFIDKIVNRNELKKTLYRILDIHS
ncbi:MULTISPECIES: acetyl-CoA carboxylase, carboxyltransferase subunit beta [Clostridium]|uniref:Acetyl-coenzyme A carboxylase carboxyl transferase subunit beta n=2 Tax=Clostridium TaxID=1485 RepID=A0A151AMA5_9CLOT|nr:MULTISPECIES: acetyl-CoA carboxylase, carboxyltransferase subunit beta [Clostridium]KYH28732.1 acetyl-coenzyme A carboxylase carboxyl transferase subunit beta [Clostridium colicanis DSM 13634]MBE6044940.1 acetyl-CoA carboxylase carboxyltransferase subunit beta [Clostridium thermopalmarium]PRR76971.1 Acetyl-coenzyme A carboxylase carboxyl transferase subunit beta [Clostridium thermopalmarium DSM 5974]PVZ21220.1 acetyl-CoA carboxylase carboxyl transferase subunit beta [Clostridium thermopalmar